MDINEQQTPKDIFQESTVTPVPVPPSSDGVITNTHGMEAIDFTSFFIEMERVKEYLEETRNEMAEHYNAQWVDALLAQVENVVKIAREMELRHINDTTPLVDDQFDEPHDTLLREQDPETFDLIAPDYIDIHNKFKEYFRKSIAS